MPRISQSASAKVRARCRPLTFKHALGKDDVSILERSSIVAEPSRLCPNKDGQVQFRTPTSTSQPVPMFQQRRVDDEITNTAVLLRSMRCRLWRIGVER
jgi:hypothetical protein